METAIQKNKRLEELQAEKQLLSAEIRKYEYNEEYLKKIINNVADLREYLRDLKKGGKTLHEK